MYCLVNVEPVESNYSKQISFNTIGTVVTLFCQWLIIMILPKIANFSEAGIFAVAISVCSVLNHVATFSLREYQVSDKNQKFTETDYKTVRLITISLSFVFVAPFVIFFDYGLEETMAILGYMVYRNLIHYAYLYSASLQIHNRLDIVGIHSAVEGVLSFVSFMGVYVLTNNLVLSIFVMAIVGGGSFLILQYCSYRELGFKQPIYNSINTKRLFLIGIPLFFSILMPTFTTALPKLILQYECGDEIAGIFSTLSTPTIIVPTLAISVFAPFITYFTDIANSGDFSKFKRKFTKVVLLILCFGFSLVMLSLFLQNWIFGIIYGEEMAIYSKYFAYLLFGVTLYTVGTLGTTTLITKNQGWLAAPLSFISFIIGLISCLITIPNSGIEGATFSLILAYASFGVLIAGCVYFVPLKIR